MKQALISPQEQISYISSWTDAKPRQPVFTAIPGSQRVAEVASQPFEVAPPLHWVACGNDINANDWYYDPSANNFVPIPAPAA